MALPQGFGATELQKFIPAAIADRGGEGTLWVPFQVDPDTGGALQTLIQPFTTGSVTLKIPTADDIDTDVASNLDKHVGLDTRAFLYGFESAGDDWDRIRALPSNADAVAEFVNGVLLAQAAMLGFNGATYDRVRALGTDADAQAVATLGALNARSFLYGFNGATFDRLHSGNTDSDAVFSETTGVLMTLSSGYLWDDQNTVWSRERGNVTFAVVIAAAARTVQVTSTDFFNHNSPVLIFEVQVDVLNSASIDFELRYLSSTDVNLFIASITTTGRHVFAFGPGVKEAAGGGGQYAGGLACPVPRDFSVQLTPPDAQSNTVGVQFARNR